MKQIGTEEEATVLTVRNFVDHEVKPLVHELDANTYLGRLIDQVKQVGVFGLAVPAPWGEVQVSTTCSAPVTEELPRGAAASRAGRP